MRVAGTQDVDGDRDWPPHLAERQQRSTRFNHITDMKMEKLDMGGGGEVGTKAI